MAHPRRTIRAYLATGLTAPALVVFLALAARAAEPAAVDFATQVQPIFVEHCYECHGPDKQEGGLRFDQRAAALAGSDSGAWFTAGDSATSEIVRRITAADESERMPPEGEQALAPEAIDTLKRWIDAGAAWPEPSGTSSNHWAFQPIARPEPPPVADDAWVRGPLDHFVLSQLEQRGIQPSPEADRYTLVKRLSYDLLGLPPSVAEVDAFVADTAPDAYERLVDRLLDSPRFGERWGRHWLDKARYADSDGYEKDNPRPDAWRYRNWIIDAVNADMPLDQFTVEQLAGDLLAEATADQQLATAFHRQTLTNTEGGTDQEEFRVAAIFDRVATTGTIWLGLTVGCAQCHSHKYDPIAHREYYQLFAFFNNGDETTTDVPLEDDPLLEFEHKLAEAQKELALFDGKLQRRRAERLAEMPQWEASLAARKGGTFDSRPIELLGAKSVKGAKIKLLSDGSYLVTGNNPDVDVIEIKARALGPQITGFRLEALADDSLGGKGPGRTDHGNFVLGEFRVFAAPSEEIKAEHRVPLARAGSDYHQHDFPPENSLDDNDATGWAVGGATGQDHAITFAAEKPVDTAAAPWLKLVLSQKYGSNHTLGRFRLLAVTGDDPLLGIPPKVRELLAVPADERSDEERAALVDYYVGRDKQVVELTRQIADLQKRVAARPVMNVRVISQRTKDPRATHILSRGDFLSPAEEVQPGTPAVLSPLQPRSGGAPDRLDLARWLVDPANPLTRRVLVNQLWSHLFGRGLVRTVDDFGVRGELPTHPQLLDWLASELASQGWSRKALIRLVVTSATYRQSSAHRQELTEVDPTNDLFHRQNRFRVEAELVRDLSLSVAGLLSDKIGGPSVFPPLPPGIAELSYANNFKWADSSGEDRYRRGMYTFFKRTAPHPNLSTFDCPDSNTACIERRASNTPLQALTTLNNVTFAEASQALAQRALLAPADDDQARLSLALRWCVARPPVPEELSAYAELLDTSRQWFVENASTAADAIGPYQPQGVPPVEAAAWVATVRILLNLDEFLTRE